MSLDLARHLPRRLLVGPAVIVTDRPVVLLSVIRKRWVKIVHEVSRQRASTLDPVKRAGLQSELDHMEHCRFTMKQFKQSPAAACFFVSPAQLSEGLPPCYPTLYLTTWLPAESLIAAVRNLPLRGLIVAYDEWSDDAETVLGRAFAERFPGYGGGQYPQLHSGK